MKRIMKLSLRSQKGMTLLEMLVAAAIFVLMVMMAGIILSEGQEQARLAEAKLNLQESARESLYRMAMEIRETAVGQYAISNGGASLTFRTPGSVNGAGIISWSNPITYQIGGNGTQLIRLDEGTGQTTVLANDIQSLRFTAADVNRIQYDVTARRQLINGRLLSVNTTGEARLRN